MKKKLMILSLAFLTLVNTTALVTIFYQKWSIRRHFSRTMMGRMPPPPFMGELDLHDTQRHELFDLMADVRKETQPIFDSLKSKEQILMAEIRSDNPDTNKLDRISEEIGELQVQLKKKFIANILQIRSTLTPEQRERFFMVLQTRMMGMEPMDKPEMGRPGGFMNPSFRDSLRRYK